MSLDVYITNTLFNGNITHNLNKMASEAGIYKALWRPEELDIDTTDDLVPILKDGLKKLVDNPEHYKKFNPSNGWGTYEGLVEFVEKYLANCIVHKGCKIEVSR